MGDESKFIKLTLTCVVLLKFIRNNLHDLLLPNAIYILYYYNQYIFLKLYIILTKT